MPQQRRYNDDEDEAVASVVSLLSCDIEIARRAVRKVLAIKRSLEDDDPTLLQTASNDPNEATELILTGQIPSLPSSTTPATWREVLIRTTVTSHLTTASQILEAEEALRLPAQATMIRIHDSCKLCCAGRCIGCRECSCLPMNLAMLHE